MSAMPSAADTGPPADELASLSLLRCGSCARRWLVSGDRRGDRPVPCPYCDDGTAGVLGVHH